MERWRKREETRSLTRLIEIEEARKAKKESTENENATIEGDGDEGRKNKAGKLRRSARLLGKIQRDMSHYI